MGWLSIAGIIVLGFGLVWAFNEDRSTKRTLRSKKNPQPPEGN
jgi:hypothetical protein